LPEANMDAAGLATTLEDFSSQRDVLLEMACRARALAMPQAARRVAELCLQVARPGGAA